MRSYTFSAVYGAVVYIYSNLHVTCNTRTLAGKTGNAGKAGKINRFYFNRKGWKSKKIVSFKVRDGKPAFLFFFCNNVTVT